MHQVFSLKTFVSNPQANNLQNPKVKPNEPNSAITNKNLNQLRLRLYSFIAWTGFWNEPVDLINKGLPQTLQLHCGKSAFTSTKAPHELQVTLIIFMFNTPPL
jgi:hypothetical protein